MKLIETIQFLKEKKIVDEQEKLKYIKEAEDLNSFKYLNQNELNLLEELNPNNDNVIPFVIIKMISNIKGVDTKDLSLIDLSLIDEDILINHQTMSSLIHEVFITSIVKPAPSGARYKMEKIYKNDKRKTCKIENSIVIS